VALALSALLTWGFVELADEVAEGAALQFDQDILGFLHGGAVQEGVLGSQRATEAVRDVTALGSFSVLGLFTAIVCGYLAITGRRRASLFVLVAVVSGIVVSHGLKAAFDRPRPDLVEHYAVVFTRSFPSGHSMLAAVVYLTLGALLARLHASWRAKAFLLGAAVAIVVLVGISRLLLAVHWPTDVLAGWAVGSSWALLCWAVFLILQRRRTVERAATTDLPQQPQGG
jgi:undecaprenyl-diphosphatase